MQDSSPENVAMAMLAMAETLRTQQPPKFKMAIKCVRGAATLPINTVKSAFVQLQLGKLLLYYTENQEEARNILETTYQLYVDAGAAFLTLRLEALMLLCEAYLSSPNVQSSYVRVMTLLRTEIPSCTHSRDITVKLLFYYIEAASLACCYDQALDGCKLAIDHVQRWGDKVMELYFRMTKQMISTRYSDGTVDEQDRQIFVTLMPQLDPHSPITQNIKLFYICTQLASCLSNGKTRSSKELLRNLQCEVQEISKNGTTLNGIRWFDSVPLTVFACLMTIVVSTLQCNYDRAHKYYQIGMRHITEYLHKALKQPSEYGLIRSVYRMRLGICEMMAQCNIMACKPKLAMDNIKEMVSFCAAMGSDYITEYGPSIHSLLGLYAVYLRDLDSAEKHFQTALEGCRSKSSDSWIMINVNLGLVYLCQLKHAAYYNIAERLVPNRVNPCSLIVRNNVKFLQGFHAFLNNKVNECKQLTAECMEVAKAEDLFRLHGLAILLFSIHHPVSLEVIKPTLDWSNKGHDHALLQWSNQYVVRVLSAQGSDAVGPFIEATNREAGLLEKNLLVHEHETHQYAHLLHWYDLDFSSCFPKDE